MLEQTTVVIGNDEIVIESLPATHALQLITKTIRIVGGLSKGIKDFPSTKEEFAKLGKELEKHLHLGNMVDGLIERLDSDELPKLIKKTVQASIPVYRDRPLSGEGSFEYWYENRFSRDLTGLLALLFEIYKFNYSEPVGWFLDFFKAIQKTSADKDPEAGSPQPL